MNDEERTEDLPEEEPTDAEQPAEAEEPVDQEPEPEAIGEPEAPSEPETAEEPGGEAKPETKAKDVSPGADLEPILLEGDRELTAEERARVEAEAEERARLEAEATAEGEEEPVVRRKVEIPADTRIQATGKRKSAIARVVVSAGNGSFEVNRKPLDDYFPREHHQILARQPLVATGFEETVDIKVRVHGGGTSGQAGAVRHGIAKALTEIDGELRRDLKRRGMLTRDARRKERRKAGLKKARKRPQFSKR